MPLSAPVPRTPVHAREIHCQGYRREDGLWEVEGRIVDRRAFAHAGVWERVNKPASTPVHEMWLRLTMDGDKSIVAVETSLDHTPCPPFCTQAGPNYQRLVGLRITTGFLKQARALVGATAGCTHVTKLLDNLATTAFQTIESHKLREIPGIETMSRPDLIALFSDDAQPDRRLIPQANGCITHAETSAAMQELWPSLYKPSQRRADLPELAAVACTKETSMSDRFPYASSTIRFHSEPSSVSPDLWAGLRPEAAEPMGPRPHASPS